METQTTEIISNFNFNAMFIAVISMFAITLLSTVYKKGVAGLFKLIFKHLTTRVEVSSSHWAYFQLIRLLNINDEKEKRIRTFRLNNGRWGDEKFISLGIGKGTHLLKIYCKLCIINLEEKDTQWNEEKFILNIVLFGRNLEFIKLLLTRLYEIKNKPDINNNEIVIYTIEDNTWKETIVLEKRAEDTIFIDYLAKQKVFNFVDNFYNRKDWYVEKGIPYQAGILLYGPPGTGKTSFVKVIASKFNKNIYYLKASELSKLQTALVTLPKDCILLIEDIDSNDLVLDRSKREQNNEKLNIETNADGKAKIAVEKINLSDILNFMDGVLSIPGRFLIATTNKKEKIDPALLRPGRIDMAIEIGYIHYGNFLEFIVKYYNDYLTSIPDYGQFFAQKSALKKLKSDTLTISELQNDFLVNELSFDAMFEKYTEYSKELP